MNLAAPMVLPSIRHPTRSHALLLPMQGQVGHAMPQGQARNDHENQMIKSLRCYIRDSLVGVPFDLPEIKGLRAKLPNTYEGDKMMTTSTDWTIGCKACYGTLRSTG
jgi:hypothetical protein